MTFAARTLQDVGFAPITHTYASGTGASEPVPVGATRCVITCQAGGGGGEGSTSPVSFEIGGGAGGEAIKTIAVWGGDAFTYTVGPGGAPFSNGSNSTVTGSVLGGAVSLTAHAGQAGGTGGTASGGDTNNTGGNAFGGTGGIAPYGGGPGNGGDATNVVQQPGNAGIIQFSYT